MSFSLSQPRASTVLLFGTLTVSRVFTTRVRTHMVRPTPTRQWQDELSSPFPPSVGCQRFGSHTQLLSRPSYLSTACLNTAPTHTSFLRPLSDCHNPACSHMSFLLLQPQQRPAQVILAVGSAYGPHVILKAVGSTSHGK